MKSRSFVPIVLFLLLSIMFSGCVLPASTAPKELPTPTSLVPFPVATLPSIATAVQQSTPVVKVATPEGQAATQAQPSAATQVINEPAKPTATPYVLPTLGKPDSYTLKKGEWPICIARRYNLDLVSFLAANNLTLDSKPAEGTSLKITSSGSWDSGPRALIKHPDTYTVSSGESIYSIACAYGDVDPMAIAAANGLKSPYTLSSGQSLQIP
jgi:hypothetical protein